MKLRMHPCLLAAVLALAPVTAVGAAEGVLQRVAQAEARGMPFEVYIRLRTGMSEAELLQRAGAPDYTTVEGTKTRGEAIVQETVVIDPVTGKPLPQAGVSRSERSEIIKTWYYLLTLADPYTTRVTLTGGRITHLERIKKF